MSCLGQAMMPAAKRCQRARGWAIPCPPVSATCQVSDLLWRREHAACVLGLRGARPWVADQGISWSNALMFGAYEFAGVLHEEL